LIVKGFELELSLVFFYRGKAVRRQRVVTPKGMLHLFLTAVEVFHGFAVLVYKRSL